MKIIALEEHFVTPAVLGAWSSAPGDGHSRAVEKSVGDDKERLLLDLAQQHVANMDSTGIDVQVLSLTTPGMQNVEPARAVPLARDANDLVAQTVRANPARFQGFAALPVSDPPADADELRRAVRELGLNGAMVFGRDGGRSIDHPDFLPVLHAANDLRAPIYLHPQSPPPPVREAYYDGFPRELSVLFGGPGVGWHYEAGVQALRLVLSGAFDRFPDLRLILGHWGEVVLFYLDRVDLLARPARLRRKVSDYFAEHVYVTPSGLFSHRYLRWALEILGPEHVMFSADYPFALVAEDPARRFLDAAGLDEAARGLIASGNWTRLSGEIRRGPAA